MRVIGWIHKDVDRMRLHEFIEEQPPRMRMLLTILGVAAFNAMTAWGLFGWSLSKSWAGDIAGGVGYALFVAWRDQRRARRDAESELQR